MLVVKIELLDGCVVLMSVFVVFTRAQYARRVMRLCPSISM